MTHAPEPESIPPDPDHRTAHCVALLYLYVAHATDHVLTAAEIDVIVERLQARIGGFDADQAHDLVMGALDIYDNSHDLGVLITESMKTLARDLGDEQRAGFLTDLYRVAEADGIVMERERAFIASLAACWRAPLPDEGLRTAHTLPAPGSEEPAGALHDLAFLFLVLAHGTDSDLSGPETQMMLSKLQQWGDGRSADEVQDILAAARERYALGPDEKALQASIKAVKEAYPEAQRRAALQDLIQIANADGFFLDNEEDLINTMMQDWELAAHSNYSARGARKP